MIDDAQAEVVRMIFRWHADESTSMRQIAKRKNCTVSLARKVRPHRRDFVRTRDAEGAYGSVRRNMGGRSCDN